jgi:hypothetical protein
VKGEEHPALYREEGRLRLTDPHKKEPLPTFPEAGSSDNHCPETKKTLSMPYFNL